jgi:hypothetical protein
MTLLSFMGMILLNAFLYMLSATILQDHRAIHFFNGLYELVVKKHAFNL